MILARDLLKEKDTTLPLVNLFFMPMCFCCFHSANILNYEDLCIEEGKVIEICDHSYPVKVILHFSLG